jgi:hypothetical protein
MARTGDDVRLAEMLLEVALDLEAEAEAIEAEQCGIKLPLAKPAEPKPSWLWGPLKAPRDLHPALSAPAGEQVS